MPAFDSLTRAPAGVRGAAELDHPAFFGSALYNEIWCPLGMKYRRAAVCRELYNGASQAAIGSRLGVLPTTVVDHARKLHRTLGS